MTGLKLTPLDLSQTAVTDLSLAHLAALLGRHARAVVADGQHDRLTDFTRPVSAAFYFAPSLTTWRIASAEREVAAPPST